MVRFGWRTGLIVLGVVLAPAAAVGEPQMLVKAKGLGLPVKNCQYCHTEPVPKKETFTPAELNPRGRWLLDDKDRRHLKTVDLDRLKTYPGGPAQQ